MIEPLLDLVDSSLFNVAYTIGAQDNDDAAKANANAAKATPWFSAAQRLNYGNNALLIGAGALKLMRQLMSYFKGESIKPAETFHAVSDLSNGALGTAMTRFNLAMAKQAVTTGASAKDINLALMGYSLWQSI